MYAPIDLQAELNAARERGAEREIADLHVLIERATQPYAGPASTLVKAARNRQSSRRRLRKVALERANAQWTKPIDLTGRTVLDADGVRRVVDMVHDGEVLFAEVFTTAPITSLRGVLDENVARIPAMGAAHCQADHAPCEALYHAIWDVLDNFAPGDPSVAGLEAAARAYEEHMKE